MSTRYQVTQYTAYGTSTGSKVYRSRLIAKIVAWALTGQTFDGDSYSAEVTLVFS